LAQAEHLPTLRIPDQGSSLKTLDSALRYADDRVTKKCVEGMRMGGQSGQRSACIATVVSGILRALPICAPAALLCTPATLAQAFNSAALTADIPTQPLAKSLEAFARQTGLQIVYVSGVVRGQRSGAVSAGLGADEALARMLEGTGLKFAYLTPRSIRILSAAVAPPLPQETTTKLPSGDALQEVIVTANRREENLQKVPIAIQVLTGDTLGKLHATTFDDFLRYLPGVTARGVGPGQNDIYMRGLATAGFGVSGSGFSGGYPNVAVYLDEQSAQLPHRNLDIYAVDLDRIEVLEGPQGTLFGAGAQAGVVRYITNKPKLDVTEGSVNAGYATTAHGAQSTNLDATINIPLIAERLAVRGVIYNERRGGYIDNIPSTFARADTDPGIIRYEGGKVPANSVVINNSAVAGTDINPVTYQGIRAEALYQFNADWRALLAQSYQGIAADGVFAEMAANSLGQVQPDLSVQLYNPSYDKDRFENTALTIDGRVGVLKIVYAGAYLIRHVEQVQDYTSYARGALADYYQCANPTLNSPNPDPAAAQCFTPSSTWRDVERNTHESHELRFSTPGDWRIRGVGGLFYETFELQNQVDWFYLTALPYFNPIGPPTGYYDSKGMFVSAPVTSNNPNVRPPGDAFFTDITRGYRQRAAYASLDFELIPSKLTLSTGTRYSGTETWEVGSTVSAFGCGLIANPTAPNPCVNEPASHEFINLDANHLDRTYSGFKSRANLSWNVTDDALLYFTWSQGFRAGGFNRSGSGLVSPISPLHTGFRDYQMQANQNGGWITPMSFAPDSLTNNEFGWKTTWMSRRIQWDGAIYQENWDHAQVAVAEPGVINLALFLNGGDYRVRGVETSLVARVTSGLSIEAAGAWNQSELVKKSTFYWADGKVIDFGALQDGSGHKVPDPGGVLGAPLAGAPSFQGNVRVRYDFALAAYDAFAQIGVVHQSHSLATTDQFNHDLQGNSTAYQLPPFTTVDGALGVGQDAWLMQLYGENLTDTRAQLFANYTEAYKAVTVNRPRTIGLRISYKFRGS
jgi:iron complex outermembrane recepter protein